MNFSRTNCCDIELLAWMRVGMKGVQSYMTQLGNLERQYISWNSLPFKLGHLALQNSVEGSYVICPWHLFAKSYFLNAECSTVTPEKPYGHLH